MAFLGFWESDFYYFFHTPPPPPILLGNSNLLWIFPLHPLLLFASAGCSCWDFFQWTFFFFFFTRVKKKEGSSFKENGWWFSDCQVLHSCCKNPTGRSSFPLIVSLLLSGFTDLAAPTWGHHFSFVRMLCHSGEIT